MTSAHALLEVRDIDFSYGELQVLFGAGFHVDEGEVLALLGTNGAGKSTALKVVSGLVRPSAGSVWFDGNDITDLDAEARVRAGIVQVSGGKALFPSLTVRDNLVAGAWLFGGDRKARQRAVDDALDLFPKLRLRQTQVASTLSGGEQQMLSVAKGLLRRPRLLIIDELSLGLAPVVVQELLAVVERLKSNGTTMVIVEQSINVALELANRAIFMEKGSVRFEGPAKELLERDDLVRAVFLGATDVGR